MAVRELASVDGVIAPTAQVSIPVQDDGLYRGDGVFEVIRLYGGRPFLLGDHLDRLERSAAAIELPAQRAELELEIGVLLEAHGDADAQLRLVVTRGGRRIALIEPLVEHLDSVRLATVTYAPTMILNGAKTLSYGANMQATRIARGGGADEALLVRPDEVVLEAPTSTIFWVSEGELRTPSLGTGILNSITRGILVQRLRVTEREYEVGDLLGASEAFLASTVREVQPVSAVDGVALSTGPRTAEAQEAFADAVAETMRTAATR
jgi:branched-chain amino acid aminotransferase